MRQCAAVNSFLIQKDLNGLQTKANVEKDTQYHQITSTSPGYFLTLKTRALGKKVDIQAKKKVDSKTPPPAYPCCLFNVTKTICQGKS